MEWNAIHYFFFNISLIISSASIKFRALHFVLIFRLYGMSINMTLLPLFWNSKKVSGLSSINRSPATIHLQLQKITFSFGRVGKFSFNHARLSSTGLEYGT